MTIARFSSKCTLRKVSQMIEVHKECYNQEVPCMKGNQLHVPQRQAVRGGQRILQLRQEERFHK